MKWESHDRVLVAAHNKGLEGPVTVEARGAMQQSIEAHLSRPWVKITSGRSTQEGPGRRCHG